MRYQEIKPPDHTDRELSEVDMSPGTLAKTASGVSANVGMEFEMIIPNAPFQETESENDYDSDEPIVRFSDIEDFFSENNADWQINRVLTHVRSEYDSWHEDAVETEWRHAAYAIVADYIDDNDLFDAYAYMEKARQLIKEKHPRVSEYSTDFQLLLQDMLTSAREKFIRKTIKNNEEYVAKLREQFIEDLEFSEKYDETSWLREQYPTMRSVYDHYNEIIEWPHGQDEDRLVDVEPIAMAFADAMGLERINWSNIYHGAKREEGIFIAEPDGSLDPDSYADGGVEIISPYMPTNNMFEVLEQVKKWANQVGAYTNSSTGLHINISTPNYHIDRLDYIKLVLLLGDEWVSTEFNRLNNTYAKSAFARISAVIRTRPELAAQAFDTLKGHFNLLASKALFAKNPEKNFSVNAKEKWVEFRSPGNDWLGKNYEKIKSTTHRFIVALDAALDPNQHRQEYLKKLYKVLAPKTTELDIVHLFAFYSAGVYPKEALIKILRDRQIKKLNHNVKYVWKVRVGNSSIEVVANSELEAKNNAAHAWGLEQNSPLLSLFTAQAIRPHQDQTVVPPNLRPTGPGPWVVYHKPSNKAVYSLASAKSRIEAAQQANAYLNRQNLPTSEYSVKTEQIY